MQNKPLIELRSANYDDIPDIMQIIKEAFAKYKEMCGAEQLDALEEAADDIKKDIDNKVVIAAVSDGAAVGCVRVQIFPDKTAYLTRFGVKLGEQNSGIGTLLMNRVDEVMKENGVKQIYLHTGARVADLMRFYYGKGFYVDEIDKSRGYVRAKLVKDYE